MAAGVSMYSIHDLALTISFNLLIEEEAHLLVLRLQTAIQKAALKELTDIVPAYHSVSLYFSNKNALASAMAFIKESAEQVAASTNLVVNDNYLNATTSLIEIPVCYQAPYAIDMPALTELLGLSQEEIMLRHSRVRYTVYMNGFVPGFSYMGTLDPGLQVPRKQIPASRVPAGSVAIAANQTGIYPFEVPGGWHVIGKTPLTLFDKTRVPACLLTPGNTVIFKSITATELEHWL